LQLDRKLVVVELQDGSQAKIFYCQWRTSKTYEDFLLSMENFTKHTRVMKDKPVIPPPDNLFHLSVKILGLTKENGAVLSSFPPHGTHKLQPLYRSVYGHCKKFLKGASDA
jgi:hypothetical protein